MKLVEVYNLSDAIKQIESIKTSVIITNPPGSIKYLGAKTIDYMFSRLKNRYSNISHVRFNIEDSIPALFTVLKMKYGKAEIIYTGTSQSAKKLLE